ncbi:MAG: biotin/lipoyl-containing protein, partial [Betaproteobacteria bacterium]
EWQLRVASGEPLPLTQDQLQIRGHAIEARICAENPDNQFLPATGKLHVYRKPDHVSFARANGECSVRVDDGVRQGDVISPFYDSMVAKLIVVGDDRAQALARLDAALAGVHIVGLSTNVQFLRHVTRSKSFASADLDTALITREQAVLFKQEPVGCDFAVAAAVAHALLAEQSLVLADPFSRRDGWRAFGTAVRRFGFEFHDQSVQARLRYLHDGALHLQIGSTEGLLSFAQTQGGIDVQYAGQRHLAQTYRQGENVHVFTPHGATRILAIDLLDHAGDSHGDGGRLTAPMPGKVLSFAVKAGDKVRKGQALAVMEAMKMEHTIAAPADGTVAELLYAPGDQVTEGSELLKMAP